ncbi:MAG: ISL3 family transposase [Lactococcus raffinolactis]|nr:ISL3 family transposase [Lactococcus raffinolactis]
MNQIDDTTKFSLQIDPITHKNITFFHCEHRSIKSTSALVYCANVSITLETCPNCGFTNLCHNGHFKSLVTYLSINASRPVYLELHKERLLCRNCHATFMATTDLVDKFCNISNANKQKLVMSLQDDRTQKSIATDLNLSASTVCRYLDNYDDLFRHNYNFLPDHLSMDEFRGLKGQLYFICANGANDHEIVQILPNRFKSTIKEYFQSFPILARKQVKTVTIDLNSYYYELARESFPNAQIIADRFHIVQTMTRSFNQTRTGLMKQHPKDTLEYRVLKYTWRLYLEHADDLEVKQQRYDRHLKMALTQAQRVQLGLDVDEVLANTYSVMQSIMYCIRHHDKDGIVDCLYKNDKLSSQMKATLITFKKHLELILNGAESNLSNGPIEGINRMIKQIQRTAFGFRNYKHLIVRIKLNQSRTKPGTKKQDPKLLSLAS